VELTSPNVERAGASDTPARENISPSPEATTGAAAAPRFLWPRRSDPGSACRECKSQNTSRYSQDGPVQYRRCGDCGASFKVGGERLEDLRARSARSA